jgi:serine/threonine protein kinase
VAIKRIHKAFEDVIDAKRVLREIKILKFFSHDHIIGLIDIQKPENPQNYDDVYIITELMEADLHQLIYSRQKLEADHYQYFMYQILRGLLYMHSANIMHRDLKPSNILINADCDLKICDFGLSRGFGDEVDEFLKKTAYVVTRWYRAPEVSLLNKSYNKSLDMWSVGCIFAELLQRTTLFPGDTNTNQVIMVLRIIGVPEDEDLEFIDNEHAMIFIQNQRK